ncbi:TPA: thiazole biosynthesis protein [Candidatus Bathyarchaeota archaeon]|nr:thiazole biosynthesis protein [Candidatus Bathyarchaeota archaeon]
MQRLTLKEVDESAITNLIVKSASEDWLKISKSDVVVVGAGPSGLTAANYLAKAGLKTVVFERKLSGGGGIGGGGMLFHKIIVQAPADIIARDLGCKLKKKDEGIYITDAAELIARLMTSAIDSGAKILFGVSVNDLIFRRNPLRIAGAVVQWTPVLLSGLHVDPLGIEAKAVIDCTGHEAEIITKISEKIPELKLTVRGERSMYAAEGEKLIVERTGRVCPGLYVAGMAAATLYGTPRMGPIFGGMLLSGKKVAEQIIRDLKKQKVKNL